MAASAYRLKVNTRSADEEGVLLLVDGRLTAILVRLADQVHEQEIGRWCVEALFGASGCLPHESFASLDEAAAFVTERFCGGPVAMPDELPLLS